MNKEDQKIIDIIRADLLKRSGGIDDFRAEVPKLIRRAIDEVIDTPRTARLTLDQTEKTEKTYIGTKIEILIRNYLNIPKGLLDLKVEGYDVDIKNTIGGNWMIPREAVNNACILVSSDEKKAICSVGIIIARPEYLTTGANRDEKKSISAEGKKQISWLIKDEPYPKNFWENVSPSVVSKIMKGRGGTERLVALFRGIIGVPISRQVIEGVARQKDYMKRLRKNGGARDPLLKENIFVLSGKYNRALIKKLGLPSCGDDEFISVKADNEFLARTIQKSGQI